MKCSKLQLQQRMKPKHHAVRMASTEKIQRYCQKRMVDPWHDEDPRWSKGFLERFRCNIDDDIDLEDKSEIYQNSQDLFLSVQTLKFQGDVKERKRSRTSFKYKSLSNGNNHRMFVKEIIEDQERVDDECSSQQNYYFDDYVKYILNSDRSRPSTGKSSNRGKENKAVQVEPKQLKCRKQDIKPKSVKTDDKIESQVRDDSSMDDAKITYQKCGKRKSLTISKAQSPETVQVIRVDVVCNYSSADSVISETEEKTEDVKLEEPKVTHLSLKKNPFASRYLLTKSMKPLDENVSGGTKVTLLCKTFRLTDRKHHDYRKRKSLNTVNKFYRSNGDYN